MSAEEYREAMCFERELKVGDRCLARWTNCGYCYEAEVEVVAINPKSYGVRITKDIDGYPAGHHLNIPGILNCKKWSWNNRLSPLLVDHYEKHLEAGVMPGNLGR